MISGKHLNFTSLCTVHCNTVADGFAVSNTRSGKIDGTDGTCIKYLIL